MTPDDPPVLAQASRTTRAHARKRAQELRREADQWDQIADELDGFEADAGAGAGQEGLL